jgi:hypothetical protein
MNKLDQAQEIIRDDPNGSDLTDENYQEVLTLLSREIRELRTILPKKVRA